MRRDSSCQGQKVLPLASSSISFPGSDQSGLLVPASLGFRECQFWVTCGCRERDGTWRMLGHSVIPPVLKFLANLPFFFLPFKSCSVQFSHSVVSNSLQPHELQHVIILIIMSQFHLIHTSNYGYPSKTLSFTLPLEIPHLIPIALR